MEYQLIISGEIGNTWSSCSVGYVRYVLNQNKGKDVHVGFCSLGGYVADGLEMMQAFRDHGKVHAHAFGMNASISTVAMLGCSSIDIVKNSFFLIHNTSYAVGLWEQANKERIGDIIKSLQKGQEELKTFDEVLAQMYADKTGKTVDECKAQMTKGNWMSAQQALDFGLVDSIRDDSKMEKEATNYVNRFVNSYSHNTTFKDAGIPPLDLGNGSPVQAAIADADGNPTQSFLAKTWQGLQNLIRNNHAGKDNNRDMIVIFKAIAALLAVNSFVPDKEGNISLSQDQMKMINDRIEEQEKTIRENSEAMAKAAETVKELKAKVAEKDEQIKSLQGSAPVNDNDGGKPGGSQAFSAADLYNAIKEV